VTAAAEFSVGARLATDREIVYNHMLEVLGAAEPRDLYDIAAEYPKRPGKGLRAAICLATCRAFGGTTEDGLDVASAIELLHNAFLVLDDIQDDSERRRGAPSLHAEHGRRVAISAASALIALAMERVLSTGRGTPELAMPVLGEFVHLLRRTHEGQWTEISWSVAGRMDITEADYLRMVQDKTCWYTTIHPLRLGALVGSRGQADLDRLVPFGFYLGAVFQIADDRANLLGDAAEYGKDIGADLYEGKRTLPVIDLLAAASDDDRRFALDALGGPSTPGRDDRFGRVYELFDHYRSIERADAFADGVMALAMASFTTAFAQARPSPDLEFLRNLIPYVRGRDS
jgi:geranylgeranyl diphosphate synthase, type II